MTFQRCSYLEQPRGIHCLSVTAPAFLRFCVGTIPDQRISLFFAGFCRKTLWLLKCIYIFESIFLYRIYIQIYTYTGLHIIVCHKAKGFGLARLGSWSCQPSRLWNGELAESTHRSEANQSTFFKLLAAWTRKFVYLSIYRRIFVVSVRVYMYICIYIYVCICVSMHIETTRYAHTYVLIHR